MVQLLVNRLFENRLFETRLHICWSIFRIIEHCFLFPSLTLFHALGVLYFDLDSFCGIIFNPQNTKLVLIDHGIILKPTKQYSHWNSLNLQRFPPAKQLIAFFFLSLSLSRFGRSRDRAFPSFKQFGYISFFLIWFKILSCYGFEYFVNQIYVKSDFNIKSRSVASRIIIILRYQN